jgi:subtilase family serine protease
VLSTLGALALVGGVLAAIPAAAAAAPAASVTFVRACAKPAARQMACDALRRTNVTQPAGMVANAVTPNATPSGYGPSDLASAYKYSTSGGVGVTVAIVDAFNDPNAASDLATYRSQFSLPACTTSNGCFSQVNQTGGSSLPSNDSGWAGEESLDMDMVSAVCPNCKILLVEANSASDADLYAAEDFAAAHATFVSNSWGGSEYSGEVTDDNNHFNHPGHVITASSGDSDTGAQFPATSQFITAVGGTSLTHASNSRGWSEVVWKTSSTEGTGSGCSSMIAKPSWQTVSTSCSRRAEADVSAVADPATGVAVFQTFGASGWTVYGGTSASAPIIASVYALAGTPGASDHTASYPYAHAGNLFDVTSGNNGSCGAPICTAGTGWDGPTGLGTPNGLAAFTNGPSPLAINNPGNQTSTVGTAVSLTVTASGGTSPYTFSATGLPAGLSISSSGAITGSPTTAASSSVTVTVNDSASGTASASFTWTVNAAGSCTARQLITNPGFESGTSPWSATAGVLGNTSGQTAHSGTQYAWLDGYGTTHTDTLSQSITIPSGCSTYTLSFWLHIDTAETTTTTQFDNLTIAVGSTTVGTFSNLNHASGYTQRSFNVSAFAGQTVTLKFTGTEDSSLQTSFVIDDTALNVS